jgi:hypothetical protein
VKILFLDVSEGVCFKELFQCLKEVSGYLGLPEYNNPRMILSEICRIGYHIYSTPIPVKAKLAKFFENSRIKVIMDENSSNDEESIKILADFVKGELDIPIQVDKVFTFGRVTAVLGLAGEEDRVVIVETKVDDVSGEVIAYAVEKLLNTALDVELIPATGKKGRPSFVLRVIANSKDAERVANAVMRETGSIGVRIIPVRRLKSPRKIEILKVKLSREYNVRVKLSGVNLKPEFEDVKVIANEEGISLPEAYRKVYSALSSLNSKR